jgi:hypothetical protein
MTTTTALAPTTAPTTPPRKPDKVGAIAILCLVDGILNVVFGISWVFGISVFGASTCGLGCILIPLGAYPLVLGILEIVYASKLLPDPPTAGEPARWLAVMQIVNVLWGQVISLVVGILLLIFFDDPEVRAYLARFAPGATPAEAGSPQAVYMESPPPPSEADGGEGGDAPGGEDGA